VTEGNYTLSALASQVLGEENLENNFYEDGMVRVAKAPIGLYVPWWFYWFLLLLLIVILILLIAWYFWRKRRKRAEESFYSGWTAWYYGYDMRNRLPKSKSRI
jgi:4-amino-4-deoxy-L-arabinose transferase-like glycosyltransferase